jgi:hypothetical protein
MLAQTASITFRILLFRAGPQDLPFSQTLTQAVVGLTLLMAFLQYHVTLPPFRAAIHAVTYVAVVGGFVYVILQMRDALNRFHQTLTALLASGCALTVLLLPPLMELAPHMERLAQNPEVARDEPLPLLPTLMVMGVSLWNFLVSAHIFRHALDIRFSLGAGVALLGALVNVVLSSVVAALFR